MNSDEHKSNDQNQSVNIDSGSAEYPDDIPTLTQQIPVVNQQIPELNHVVEDERDLIPELTALADPEEQIPELTEIAEHDHAIKEQSDNHNPEDTPPLVIHTQVSDSELEQQQWQIEQQAYVQRGDWHALADIESSSSSTNVEANHSTEVINLTEEQEVVLEASWERLESLIMDNMPVEIAGTYLSILEQHLESSKQVIARDISLLDQEDLESILDFYQIDRGF